jgi:hypothetical protein
VAKIDAKAFRNPACQWRRVGTFAIGVLDRRCRRRERCRGFAFGGGRRLSSDRRGRRGCGRRGWCSRRRGRRRWRLLGRRFGHLLTGFAECRDGLAHGDGFARLGEDAQERPGFEGFDLDGGFVGFDLRHDVAALDPVTHLLDPADHGALGHVVAHLGHQDVFHSITDLAAATTSSSVGTSASSRFLA